MDTPFSPETPSSPPPGYMGSVWPPPPQNDFTPELSVPFKTMFLRVEGSVPDFRNGNVQIGQRGIVIQGKAITPYEKQIPLLILTLFLRIFVIVALVYEYALRKDAMLALDWSQVRQIVTVPDKYRVSIVYDAPNYKEVVKPYSLTFKLPQPEYDAFIAAAEPFVGSRIQPGKLRSWSSPPTIIFLIALLVLVIVIGIFALMSNSGVTR